MTLVSVFIVAFVFFFILKGLLKGLIAEVLGMASVIFSVIIGLLYFEPFSKILNKAISFIPYYLLPMFSLLFLMATAYFSCLLVIKLLNKMVDSLSLTWLNRSLGGVVGFLKGALFISLIIMILSFLLPKPIFEEIKTKHIAVKWFEPIFPEIYKILNDKEFTLSSPSAIKKWYEEIDNKSKSLLKNKIDVKRIEEQIIDGKEKIVGDSTKQSK